MQWTLCQISGADGCHQQTSSCWDLQCDCPAACLTSARLWNSLLQRGSSIFGNRSRSQGLVCREQDVTQFLIATVQKGPPQVLPHGHVKCHAAQVVEHLCWNVDTFVALSDAGDSAETFTNTLLSETYGGGFTINIISDNQHHWLLSSWWSCFRWGDPRWCHSGKLPFQFGLVCLYSGFIKGYDVVQECITFVGVLYKLRLAMAYLCHLYTLVRWCRTQRDAGFLIPVMSFMLWQMLESLISTYTANGHIIKHLTTSSTNFTSKICSSRIVFILRVDYPWQYSSHGKRLSPTMWCLVIIHHHMLPAEQWLQQKTFMI
jgi:hypothetical protein